ncbi:helix-turn-helix domain-containing protein [Nocardia goodfellowii]|uniref:HTH cro/C1-type domain-containing protein n=1 Tax=Nocardia goodfellowii TaxID=882446 RepID=A0ABS4QNG7_9NOCA|nr:helix-turn-helix transcriptional regulator [Nocardia goodfellowii]MBP2193242.1 hypothetical protein [Nocardia goodfellowii]
MSTEPVKLDVLGSDVAERGPTALRIAIGGQLRKLREECDITREAAGEHIRGSHAKISRLELGRHAFKERDITDLLTLYGVSDPDQRERLLDLVRKANHPGWWHTYGDLFPPWFETYLGLEGAASSIRTFENQLVPGLLQTEDYARAVLALGPDTTEAARQVELRRRRQEILTAPNGPKLWAVLEESVLHRPIGGTQVLRAQIEHLLAMSTMPNVTLQVLPYTAGISAAAGCCSFTLLRFAEQELPDIVYVELLTNALYLERRQDLERYRQVMERIVIEAEQPERARHRLRTLAAQL